MAVSTLLYPRRDFATPGTSAALLQRAARLEMATDLTVDGLHLETFVPADAATAAAHQTP